MADILILLIPIILINLFFFSVYFAKKLSQRPKKPPTPETPTAETPAQKTETKSLAGTAIKVVATIVIAIIIIWAGFAGYNHFFSDDSLNKNSANKYSGMPKSSSIATNIDNSVTVTMTGKEPNGIATGITLAPGESVKVKHLSGKIICNNKNDYSAPIWGVSIEKTDRRWIPLMLYADKGIWTNAICVILQGEGEETIYSFQENNEQVIAKNIAKGSRKVILYFHEATGYSNDNEGNAKFSVKKI